MMETFEESWGLLEVILDTEKYKVKRITIKPGCQLPDTLHTSIGVCWTVVFGDGIIVQDNSELDLTYGTWWIIPPQSLYMAKAGSDGLVLIQTETGIFSNDT